MADFLAEVQGYVPSLRRYARVLTRDADAADDLVQDCLERAISRRLLWRRKGSLKAWLFSIMHNVHANQVRYRAVRPSLVGLDDVTADAATPADQGSGLTLRDLEAALGRLPEEQRQAVLLVALEGLSYADIAHITGVPVGTVMSRIARGREALRGMMDGEPRPNLRRVR
jgi:RNA polymerase sigma-70 factor (ECF subfamily)